MDREFRPPDVEARWCEAWEAAGAFRADPEGGRAPFCMVIPPPNVTGNLHIGHVLVYTLHDIMARWQRMRGRDVLWLPGTDHAGIATQMVVERELAKSGTTRHDLGRAAFESRVWQWKETYGGNITRALRHLGASCDWSRERFTLDDGLSRAVREVFVRLYDEKLIYRDRYIVQWCPRCSTALSDLETVYQPVAGQLYTIRYRGATGGPEVLVATTRPETLLGDTGVAVHPDDPRYAALVGSVVEVPLTRRSVPIVADTFVDPEFGTGAVKITPAHDPADFAAGRRHGLPELSVIQPDGRMAEAAGAYRGLDRLEARRRVVHDLEERGLLVRAVAHEHAVGHCQRCSTPIEPLVSTQWFVRVLPLAEPAIRAVEEGRTRFVPETWTKTYFEWMRNIHDWCISRQLWWGHRIPAWYCEACPATIVAVDPPAGCARCGGPLRQDEDVLDTWFSSALWPFSTMGWPDRTRDLDHYYPTDLLITGHDIIFFWVARMMMMGLKFQGDVPFRSVYIHGLVRDAQGQKMSKSKGNTIEPAELMERYGTDAMRFTMAILAAPGNDIPLAPKRMEGYQAFANKLWNATRFALLHVGDGSSSEPGPTPRGSLADRWIRSRLATTIRDVDAALEAHRFDRAADVLYHFVWHEYCDWYIEFAKFDLAAAEAPRAATTRATLLHVLDRTLCVLHPFMPFVTEELWHRLPGERSLLALASWPSADDEPSDEVAESDIARLQTIVVKIRNLRSECRLDAGQRIRVLLHADDTRLAEVLSGEARRLATLVRAETIEVGPVPGDLGPAARGVASGTQIVVPLAGLLDLEAEGRRIRRDLERLRADIDGRAHKLGDAGFLAKAPAEVIEKERRLHAELVAQRDKIEHHLATLGLGSAGPA